MYSDSFFKRIEKLLKDFLKTPSFLEWTHFPIFFEGTFPEKSIRVIRVCSRAFRRLLSLPRNSLCHHVH